MKQDSPNTAPAIIFPPKFKGSGTRPTKGAGKKGMEKRALFVIQECKKRIGHPITMVYGQGKYRKPGHEWRISAGYFKATHADFVKAVALFAEQVFPELKKINDEKRSNDDEGGIGSLDQPGSSKTLE